MRTSACCGPLRCVRKNDWFSECERCVETYGQCGGGEHVGGTCCVKTTDECVEIDEYFSQCQPIAAEASCDWKAGHEERASRGLGTRIRENKSQPRRATILDA